MPTFRQKSVTRSIYSSTLSIVTICNKYIINWAIIRLNRFTKTTHSLLCSSNHFQGEPRIASFHSVLFPLLFWKRTSRDKWHKLQWNGCPSCLRGELNVLKHWWNKQASPLTREITSWLSIYLSITILTAPHQRTGRDHQGVPYQVAEHYPARPDSLQPHTERSSRPGWQPSSVEADVYVWCYALLVVHARKEKGLQRNGALFPLCPLSVCQYRISFANNSGLPHHTTAILRPFFRDHPGEPVPEENFWTLWCKGRLTEADTLAIRLGATPSGLTSAHLHHPPGLHKMKTRSSIKQRKT